jgi:mannose-6-phosphate isomerase
MTQRQTALRPIVLGANQPPDRPYRGGAGIARFRGIPQDSEYTPEDFVGSTTEVHAGGGVGLTVLPDGTQLRDAVIANPIGYLGEQHVRRFGARTMLLVKLLDTGERLFVHFHPDDETASRSFDSPIGKTEAWIVVDIADGETGYAELGFSRTVSESEIADWVDGQNIAEMRAAMNRIDLRKGDTLLVPAGLPHAIGPGLTLVELQQPTDLSILLEYSGYHGLSRADAFLGTDIETALGGLDRRNWSAEQLALLGSRRDDDSPDPGRERLFPADADDFFSAERISVRGSVALEQAFSLLVVVSGAGTLAFGGDGGDGDEIPIEHGFTVLIPHDAGAVELRGELDAIRCRPPIA